MVEAKAKRRTQEERSAFTREALIRAAVECICDVGYAGTTAALIADRASVTRGAVQHHFGSRDELILSVIDSVQRDLNFRIDTAALITLPLEQRIDALVDQYRTVFSDKPFLAALNIWLGVRSEPQLYERLKTLLVEVQAPIGKIWRDVFADLAIEPSYLQSIRRITMAAARGYAIQELFGTANSWDRDCEALRMMLRLELTRSAGLSRSSPRSRSGSQRRSNADAG